MLDFKHLFREKKIINRKNDKKIINHARKSLLFNKQQTWIKEGGLFGVTIGACDGAEVCELIYLLKFIFC